MENITNFPTTEATDNRPDANNTLTVEIHSLGTSNINKSKENTVRVNLDSQDLEATLKNNGKAMLNSPDTSHEPFDISNEQKKNSQFYRIHTVNDNNNVRNVDTENVGAGPLLHSMGNNKQLPSFQELFSTTLAPYVTQHQPIEEHGSISSFQNDQFSQKKYDYVRKNGQNVNLRQPYTLENYYNDGARENSDRITGTESTQSIFTTTISYKQKQSFSDTGKDHNENLKANDTSEDFSNSQSASSTIELNAKEKNRNSEVEPRSNDDSLTRNSETKAFSVPKIIANTGSSQNEDLADFSNLTHHQKSLEELSHGQKKVIIKENGFNFGNQESTALILGGMCILILLLICLLFMVKKWRKNSNKNNNSKKMDQRKNSTLSQSSVSADFCMPPFLSHFPFIESISSSSHGNKQNSIAMQQSRTNEKAKYLDEVEPSRLWFSILYEEEKSDVHVNILHARFPPGLKMINEMGDLWIEVLIITPLNTVKAVGQTTVRRATYSPVFNHSLLFILGKKEVKEYVLKFILHHVPLRKSSETVGSFLLPLSSVNLVTTETICREFS